MPSENEMQFDFTQTTFMRMWGPTVKTHFNLVFLADGQLLSTVSNGFTYEL
jgi:hypothetical protein